jgi:hypothetical protein
MHAGMAHAFLHTELGRIHGPYTCAKWTIYSECGFKLCEHTRAHHVCKLAQSATQTRACTPSPPHTQSHAHGACGMVTARCIVHGTAAARKRNIVTHRVRHRHAATRHTGVQHASSKRFRCTNLQWQGARQWSRAHATIR